MRTVVEAVELVEKLFRAQVAAAEGVEPNAAADGDASAKRQFLGLLPPHAQRRVFLKFARRQAFWPRIRTLCGAPPFMFLRTEDEGLVRAGGVARGRVRLTNPGGAQTFVSHFADEHDRSFQALAAKDSPELLPFVALREGAQTVLAVRLKRRSDAERRRLLAEGEKEKLLFPQPGTSLQLVPNSLTRDSVGALVVVVLKTLPTGGSAARILCKSTG